ncbi:MAG TPA: LysM peptidoglycan-binding domain-containing protein [Saprospiraceae bacterium]|nr:LysM peptidoglycan-binding domain-containing protein [Saprospiraceae bacterium]
MRKTSLSFFIWLLISWVVGAQNDQPSPLLGPKDSLLLTVEGGKKFIHHPTKAKQTLFSISRYYQVGLEELFDNNPSFRNDPTLKAGTRIKIPVPNKAIKRYKSSSFVASKNTPIYYVVQPGDNLFQISKRYFEMPVDSVLKRNKLKSNSLKPGQRLLMGWMGTEGIHADWRSAQTSPESEALKGHYQEEKKNRKEISGQGVCFWPKDSKEKGSLYALHREAAMGTIIQVNNPMNNRIVYAKVIGRIPSGYERNVEVVLSPEAALKLGARDPRFFVKTKYLK